MGEDFYKVLGVEPRASTEQIETAYRFCVELYGDGALATSALLEPAEAEDQRRSVDEAYLVLSDPERRRAYDESRGLPPDEASPFAASTVSLPRVVERPASVVFAEPAEATARLRDRRLGSLLARDSPGFEAFRVLRSKVATLASEAPLRCLGLVSATAGEGTSAAALGLAAALAREGDRVLLVEASLRAPALARLLGLSASDGLGDWLANPLAGPAPLQRVQPWGFHLLAAGAPAPQATELLVSDAMARLAAAARVSFDVVLVDCPPLEKVADAVALQELLDGFLFVVRARHAPAQAVRDALARLRKGAVRGVVFNDRTEILARFLDRRRARRTS